VRSSFASEDAQGQLAAGVYESVLNVLPADVEAAMRVVLGSVLAPGAVAYAVAHGRQPAQDPVAVLVHAFVAGDAEGSAAFAPDRMSEPMVMLRRGTLPPSIWGQLVRETAELARARGASEVEWVLVGERLLYLQLRPFEPPKAPEVWTGFAELGADDGPPERWRWDAAHNPLPLSPAQAGLVALVDGRCHIGFRQRVLGGYLFYQSDARPLPAGIATEAAESFFAGLRTDVEQRLSVLGERPRLDAALDLFLSSYERIFGVLQPALRSAHADLRAFLAEYAPGGLALIPSLRTGVPSMASERRTRCERLSQAKTEPERALARASYLALFGDEAPMWDVATPTYAETPFELPTDNAANTHAPAPWQDADRAIVAMLPPDLHAMWRRCLGLARTAVALGEADDWLYARTQTAVRRALLVLGRRLREDGRLERPDDVFFLPFQTMVTFAAGSLVEGDLAALAAQARQAWDAARNHPPPWDAPAQKDVVRGAGTGGRALGCVAFHRPGLTATTTSNRVLVAKTILPTELPLLAASAFVTETGGALDHVAAQARERGIPAVVGARGACGAFSEGDLVLVDGDRGLVVRLR
jgi:pyruvate,water dikinase